MAKTEQKQKLTDEQKAMVRWIKKNPLASHKDFAKEFLGEEAGNHDLVVKTIHTLVEAKRNNDWH